MAMLKDILVKSTSLTEKLVRRMDRDSGGETSGEEEEVSLEERVGRRRQGRRSRSESEEEVLGERVRKRRRQHQESDDEDEAEDSEDDHSFGGSVASPLACRCISGGLQASCRVASCPCSRAGRQCGEACHLGRPWHTVPCLNTERGQRVGQMATQEMIRILAEADIYVVMERGGVEYKAEVAKRLAVHYLGLEEGVLLGAEAGEEEEQRKREERLRKIRAEKDLAGHNTLKHPLPNREFSGLPLPPCQPLLVSGGVMKDYQLAGFRWRHLQDLQYHHLDCPQVAGQPEEARC